MSCKMVIIINKEGARGVKGGARGVMVIVVGNGHGANKFKSWTRLIAFHIALIPLGKV